MTPEQGVMQNELIIGAGDAIRAVRRAPALREMERTVFELIVTEYADKIPSFNPLTALSFDDWVDKPVLAVVSMEVEGGPLEIVDHVPKYARAGFTLIASPVDNLQMPVPPMSPDVFLWQDATGITITPDPTNFRRAAITIGEGVSSFRITAADSHGIHHRSEPFVVNADGTISPDLS